ncbi:hypothetical protein QEN19_003204 [Hanseniaspora menglaensis]
MPTKSIYIKRKYIQLEFDCLPNNFSTVVIRRKKVHDNAKERYEVDQEEQTNNCKIEKRKLKDFMLSIGTVFAKAQGISEGFIYFNEHEQLDKNEKYSLYCLQEADGSLRIDFLKLSNGLYDSTSSIYPQDLSDLDFDIESFVSSGKNNDTQRFFNLTKVLLSEHLEKNSKKTLNENIHDLDVMDENYKVPIMVFKGSKLNFLTDTQTPFIGVVEFV